MTPFNSYKKWGYLIEIYVWSYIAEDATNKWITSTCCVDSFNFNTRNPTPKFLQYVGWCQQAYQLIVQSWCRELKEPSICQHLLCDANCKKFLLLIRIFKVIRNHHAEQIVIKMQFRFTVIRTHTSAYSPFEGMQYLSQ